jgi:uncharacterized protein (TIGR02145 family)
MIKIMDINFNVRQLLTVIMVIIFFGSCKKKIDYVDPTWTRAIVPMEGATVKIDFFKPNEKQVFRWKAIENASYKIYFDLDMHFQNPYVLDMGSQDSLSIKNSELLDLLREVYPEFSSIKRFFWKVEQKRGDEISFTWRYFNAILSVENFEDCRDGQKYEARQFVLLDGSLMTIMAENLRANKYTDGSPLPFPYKTAINDNAAFVTKAGGYYPWASAVNMSWEEAKEKYINDEPVQGVCPCGWHLPSYKEIDALRNYLGASGANLIKDPSYWSNINGITNSTQMNILASGFFWHEGANVMTSSFGGPTESMAGFWTSTPYVKGLPLAWGTTTSEDDNTKAIMMAIYDTLDGIYMDGYSNRPGMDNRAYPVRCIMDKIE